MKRCSRRHPIHVATLLAFAILGGQRVYAQSEAQWPSFLGFGKTTAAEFATAPVTWDAKKNVAWNTKLKGYGQSSPVVWENQVYVTCIDGPMKDQCRVHCMDLNSGETKWTHEASTKNLIPNDDYHSRGAMTPVADGRGVVASFESGLVVALDRTGRKRWSVDLFEKYGSTETNHGISSSLCQSDKWVFVWIQRKDDPYVVALHKDSGEEVWRTARPAGVSWGSPVMLPTEEGTLHLVMSCSGRDGGAGFLCGLEIETGKELWRLEGLSGNSSQTPYIVSAGRVLVGASAGREGGPSKEAIATNGLVKIKKTPSGYVADYVWRSQRATCGFCSPTYHDGYAYFTDRRGIVTCMDIETGEVRYSERLDQSVWATPLGIGDKLYFAGEVGTTLVLRAGPKFERLSTNVLWEDDADAQYAPPSRPARGEANRDANRGSGTLPASSIPSASQPNPQTAIPKTKPRQYAVVFAGNKLLIRRGDQIYAIADAANQ
ncbi:outer membrane biogenesis protein BamB [Pirellula sp. SH-Sr6A]|uniref:outer membrane protein assembly factor BamB family protein n=1 Tax=Pirellula sp. SH-Sr6A TaxID=1632865 RepID=UPI00078E1963|nr:PQQ-binding-like beta-propeller repeat protein [Pirellula sp. SH-Sr6A]AMV30998.1 outer membrane biogenesis protein BamB [Pirellula sp. SH-Sr6A]